MLAGARSRKPGAQRSTRVARAAAAAITFAIASATLGWAAAGSIDVVEGSKVWVEGGSTVRSWKCEAVGMQSNITTNSDVSLATLTDLGKLVREVTLDIPVDRMECGNNTMNEHMRKALKSKEAPSITFRVASNEMKQLSDTTAQLSMNGKLSISGKTNDVVVTGTVLRGAGAAIRVLGKYEFEMSGYGVKPPSLMLGTMKVKDKVTVNFDITLR